MINKNTAYCKTKKDKNENEITTITYNFVNGESVKIELTGELKEILLRWHREEEAEERRIRYNERRLDEQPDRGDWASYIPIEFDEERQEIEKKRAERQERLELEFDSLSENQRRLITTLYGKKSRKGKEVALEEGVSPQAIHNRVEKIRKKLKNFL